VSRFSCACVIVWFAGPIAAADLPASVDCAADARLLDSLFARYGFQPPRTIFKDGPGIRLYLPAQTQTVQQTGLYSYFSVAGDFEVSANYELINVPPVKDGYEATCGIAADTQGPGGMVALVRGEIVGKGGNYVVTHGQPDNTGDIKYDSTFYPSTAKVGRMVLRREKTDVICLAADNPQEEPRELCRVAFSPATVRQVRVFADPGGAHTTVDARMTQIQVRAVEIAGGVPKYVPPRGWGWWWWAGGGCAIATVLVLLTLRFQTGHWLWSGVDD
jgi:hypothetical protein